MRRIVALSLLLFVAGCGPRSTDAWIKQLQDPDVLKRRQAVRELGNRSGDAEQVVPALAGALSDENEYVRRDAARALATFGSEARTAVPALNAALKDEQASVRAAAAAALKQIAPPAAAKAALPSTRN